MKPEAQRIAIAEALEWTEISPKMMWGLPPNTFDDGTEHCLRPIPDLLNDLREAREKLAAVTEQRDVANQCHKWCYEDRKRIIEELATVTAQRDMLAEALRNCLPFITGDGCGEYSDAREALQSLTQNAKP